MARPLLELGTYLCYVFISRCANYIPSKWCWWCFPLLLTNYLHFERSCVFRCQQKSTDVYCRHTTNGAPPNTHKDPFTMVKTMQAKPSIKRTSKKPLDGCTAAETKKAKKYHSLGDYSYISIRTFLYHNETCKGERKWFDKVFMRWNVALEMLIEWFSHSVRQHWRITRQQQGK